MEAHNLKQHWDTVYQKEDEHLGWFEPNPEQTLALIAETNLSKDATILNVGAGTTTLIEALLDKGFTNIIANDLSNFALRKLKDRVQKSHHYHLKGLVDDLTNPKKLNKLLPIDLWIDRAVLHFFLKEEEQKAYFNLVKKIVSKKGFVIIAVFSLDGAEKCSGLPLQRYNPEMLQNKLGLDFKLIKTFNFTFINPFGGERPYVYTLFQRQ
ncbi:MAG: class I SAM-dependent methyltransferase [Flavobacteriales bacterium]|nr:class I SAM-dependent methyltransferase [Flavobacteriia bacterium]NCP05822.1 class I SAM-dependent methyltransferase [Flavobacteriales bacterium]PIV94375.1 MAG: class I SAM-dependent methyltransferase [Flavobacteriaceae bacterium CG17_big_fil_post_rev_8_21_14_2_50_33_15]PIY09198.1 MAG: class I SAM-dependent methyltransferase [Flavobacteriaceae bacterium CG_4_10_14_3_um_filter_33_47]PJB19491.1 MAG: class I SAM-dependent methyltransferase [Flavobacteriaceae bacterium CG_4_9_14_3_um_filter_33_1